MCEQGRTIKLIQRHTGMMLKVSGALLNMSECQYTTKHLVSLATKMALSANAGGVLRWFVTPAATTQGYKPELREELEQLALRHGCKLELLRSKVGHMCLMLIPEGDCPDLYAANVAEARAIIIPFLTTPE